MSWALGPTFSIFQLGIFPIDLRPRRRANINAAINLQRRYAAGAAPRPREGDPFFEGGMRGRRKNRARLRVADTLYESQKLSLTLITVLIRNRYVEAARVSARLSPRLFTSVSLVSPTLAAKIALGGCT